MSLGKAPSHEDLFRSSGYCADRLSPTSIYGLLNRECHRLFPDDSFADLFDPKRGRRSISPRIVAVVMVLQRLEGLSDREAADRFTFDLRWKFAAGGLEFTHEGFVHTVLVDMRARLSRSERPNRIFEAALEVAKSAGLIGRKRVLDSTALYDAVATQDTVTLIRSSIRGLLRVADGALATELRSVLKREDDYDTAGKPVCDWDDAAARAALVDALARDAFAVLACLHDRKVAPEVEQAAKLVATVVGQDLEEQADGLFRIAHRVAVDRVISTVDPEARHGHKTAARGFDGYKGHIAIDPDSEIIVASTVTPGNAADGAVVQDLLSEDLEKKADTAATPSGPLEVYGDSSYGTAKVVDHLESAGAEANVKVQAPSAPAGKFSKDDFCIDVEGSTVTCPAGVLVQIQLSKDGGGIASFGAHCSDCPLRPKCTSSKEGRSIRLHPRESTLQRLREQQKSPDWVKQYKATRPKVERKIAHLTRRRHGGRRACVRGCKRLRQDFSLLSAAVNLSRLAVLRVHYNGTTWTC